MRAEFTVEPFDAGRPGAHVLAAVDAVRACGLQPELGPFATQIAGTPAQVSAAVGALTAAALAGGATRISITVEQG